MKPSQRLPDLKVTEVETLGQQNSALVKTGCEARSYPQGLDMASNKNLSLKSATYKNKKPRGKICKEKTQNLTK